MIVPRVGTVRHVIVNKPKSDLFYWVTWEQFRVNKQAEWTQEARKFETLHEAKQFSLSL